MLKLYCHMYQGSVRPICLFDPAHFFITHHCSGALIGLLLVKILFLHVCSTNPLIQSCHVREFRTLSFPYSAFSLAEELLLGNIYFHSDPKKPTPLNTLLRYVHLQDYRFSVVKNPTARIDQLFYFQQREIEFEKAMAAMISGFCRDVFYELPDEFGS
ncbi:upf0051 protein abci8 [Quercus suber]|uniref:Upf0051 protein abci8 n=1 Tax=Quercus suber TaxID=58331 RepID=A0AAW0JVS1_QUESU